MCLRFILLYYLNYNVMKKIFIFISILVMGVAFSGCDWLVKKAEAEVLGAGKIQQGKGGFYIELDSLCYVPEFIYTNNNGRDGKQKMAPVEGMQVTCFRLYGEPNVYFIAGVLDEEYLNEYFKKDYWFGFVLLVCLFLVIAIAAISQEKKMHKVLNEK